MVIPLEDSMKEKQKFMPVLLGTMVIVTALFLSFGLCGYAAFEVRYNAVISGCRLTTCCMLRVNV